MRPFLYFFNPALVGITDAILGGDVGAILGWAGKMQGLAREFDQHGTQLREQAAGTASFWDGAGADTFRTVTSNVASGIQNHAGEVDALGRAAEKVARDVDNIMTTVNHGQAIADQACKVLSGVPWVGHALARAYAMKTTAWTIICGTQLVTFANDVGGLLKAIEGDHVARSWTPPAVPPAPTPTFADAGQHHEPLPFA